MCVEYSPRELHRRASELCDSINVYPKKVFFYIRFFKPLRHKSVEFDFKTAYSPKHFLEPGVIIDKFPLFETQLNSM